MSFELQPYQPRHVDALLEAAVESVEEVQPWLPWCRPDLKREELESWIAQQVAHRKAGTEFEFVIASPEGRFLGGCGLNNLDREYRVANLGYWVRTSETGKGIATKAVQLLRDWAFRNTDLERLELVVAVGNRSSVRVAQKAGALFEGILHGRLRLHDLQHDSFMYAFVRPRDASGV